MRKETIALETLRQRIAAFDWDAIDLAEQLERGLPGGKQTKAAFLPNAARTVPTALESRSAK
jgi:hypothetical protein